MLKTYKYRIKDKSKLRILDAMARDVKFTWNVLNSASRKKWKESRKYYHKYDPYFTSIIKGASKYLSINARTIQAISESFHTHIHKVRKQLRYKSKKQPGWVPFKGPSISIRDDRFIYDKKHFKIWKHRPFPANYILKCGHFSQDNLGRWYVNFVIEFESNTVSTGKSKVGIDLGLKTTATCSDGTSLNLKSLDKIDNKIKKYQKSKNKYRVKKLNFYKKNKRKDLICNFAKDLVKRNSLVAIGNITGFTQGHWARSRYQNAWYLTKTWLEFKCKEYNVSYMEVSEYLTTQTCNKCKAVNGPKGVKELSVRHWECSCGAVLNRDINAATNILNVALAS